MYRPRRREAASNALPPLRKTRANACFVCKCGKQVKIGESIFRESRFDDHVCSSCGITPSASNVVPISETTERQKHLDRISSLSNLPGPLKPHLQNELDELKRLVQQIPKPNAPGTRILNEWIKWMPAKHPGVCIKCGAKVNVHEPMGYHRVRKTVTCESCL